MRRRPFVRGAVSVALAAAAAGAIPSGAALASGPSVSAAGAPVPVAVRAAAPFATAPLPYSFRRSGFDFVEVPLGARAYAAATAASFTDDRAHTAAGVRVLVVGGRTFDYPVGQASRGIEMLDGYRITHQRRYLAVALANARRLVATKVVDRTVVAEGAWFLPHRYPFSLHRYPTTRMPTPFYSAMAQGKVLTLFSRLAELTGSREWRAAANHVFASFLQPRRYGRPWAVDRDLDGHLWLEEWAAPTGRPRPDRTFNGHNFSAAGLYDYWALTHDARAAALLDGALTSTLDRLPTVRNKGWISHYCRSHPEILSAHYHATHVGQLLWFHQMTGDPRFARWADLLESDYPVPEAPGSIVLAAGRHQAIKVDAADRQVGTASVSLARTAWVRVDLRARLHRRAGLWWHMVSGPLAGAWVREQAGYQYRPGALVRLRYRTPRAAVAPAGTKGSFVLLAASGRVVRHAEVAAGPALQLTIDRRATIDGVEMLRVASGQWRYWWVRAALVRLDPPAAPTA